MLDVVRAADCNQGNIMPWHKRFEEVLKQFGITNPGSICNCDETRSLFIANQKNFLNNESYENPYSITNKVNGQITVLMRGRANGKILSPFILLLPRKDINPSYAVDLPAEATCNPTEKGVDEQKAFLLG